MLLYRFLISLFALFVLVPLLVRGRWGAVQARLGMLPTGPGVRQIWLHAASNGELASVRPVLNDLLKQDSELHVLVTCNTDSGVALARSFAHPRIEAHLAPLDLSRSVGRLLRDRSIAAHITLESEFWPTRIRQLSDARLPIVALGARLTPRTARSWARLGRVTRRMLGQVSLLSAQDDASARRFSALGLRPQALSDTVDLKSFYTPDDTQRPDADLQNAFPRDSTWLAASTHEEEEAFAIAAHQIARKVRPELRLILAPRHPRRGNAVAQLLSEAGLSFTRRTEPGSAFSDVLLADTMGEMPLWYDLSGAVFVGGSIAPRGGHTPYEPAAFGCAILHGPDTRNFAAVYDLLHRDDAAVQTTTPAALADALVAYCGSPAGAQLGAKAKDCLRPKASPHELATRIFALLSPKTPGGPKK